MALVQLLTEYPDLPHASWSVALDTGSLHGHVHTASFEALNAYTAVLGGSVRPGGDFPLHQQMMRPHRLHSTWRDVRVEVVVVLPAPVVELVSA
jgi:hypothetical protein